MFAKETWVIIRAALNEPLVLPRSLLVLSIVLAVFTNTLYGATNPYPVGILGFILSTVTTGIAFAYVLERIYVQWRRQRSGGDNR